VCCTDLKRHVLTGLCTVAPCLPLCLVQERTLAESSNFVFTFLLTRVTVLPSRDYIKGQNHPGFAKLRYKMRYYSWNCGHTFFSIKRCPTRITYWKLNSVK